MAYFQGTASALNSMALLYLTSRVLVKTTSTSAGKLSLLL
jgi:hypothetical protein